MSSDRGRACSWFGRRRRSLRQVPTRTAVIQRRALIDIAGSHRDEVAPDLEHERT